jgi:hypothetical protein
VKDWSKEHAFRDLFFSLPEMRENEFIAHLYQANREEEDEGERALPRQMVPIARIKKIPSHPEHTCLSLATIPDSRQMTRPLIRRKTDG